MSDDIERGIRNLTVGDKIKEYRLDLGLSQADVADAVGTTQQTVDRIERNAVSHSRYLAPILVWLEDQFHQRSERERAEHEINTALYGRKSTNVESFLLEDEELVPDPEQKRVRAPDQIENLRGLYSVVLTKGFQGPIGDVIYRPGDRLFVHPTKAPRNFDICLAIPSGGAAGPAQLRVVIDKAYIPVDSRESVSAAFAWSDDESLRFARVVATITG